MVKADQQFNLNKEQLTAINHIDGPILVVAGAGTGKTAVITQRIAHLINNAKVDPSSILALTFTDKAAGEMEARVDRLVPYGYIDTWISTFHAFGDRILRSHALESGLSPTFSVLTQAEQVVFLRAHIFEVDLKILRPTSNPLKFLPLIITHINHLKDEMISPNDYLNYVNKLQAKAKSDDEIIAARKFHELAMIYANYNEWLEASDQIDFGDQILRTIRLFCNHPDILAQYQSKFQYCLVDEYQDTNRAQNELLKLLFASPKAKHHNIMVVGDDDQSIYQFRGAAIQNIMQFQSIWPDSKIIVLNQNYRSQQGILDAAYDLIKFNNPDRLEIQAKIDKRLVGQSKGTAPEWQIFEDDYSEAKYIASEIKQIISDKKYRYKDIAILTRANMHAKSFIQELRAQGIPYYAPGLGGLYDETVVRLMISFLKSVADFDDSLSLYYLATSSIFQINTVDMIAINSFVKRNNLIIRQLINNLDDYPDLKTILSNDTVNKVKHLARELEYFTIKARDFNVGEVLYQFLEKSGYLKKLIKNSEKDLLATVDLEHIAVFYEKIKQFIRSSDNTTVMNFVNNLTLLRDAGENPALSQFEQDVDAVTILSVHGAKGLEWPIVFIPSLSSDRFPTRFRQDAMPLPAGLIDNSTTKDFHIQEERRLFYVAITRAKVKLYLTMAEHYDNSSRTKKISQFVYETIGNDIIKNARTHHEPLIAKLALFDSINIKPQPKVRLFHFDNLRLNPHQIDDYLTCPKKFEYIHILQIPITTSGAVAYGNAIHQAIGYYYLCKQANQPVTIEDVIAKYKQAWSSEGYVTREHEKEKFRAGQQSLIDFYVREEKTKRKVVAVEDRFEFEISKIKISGRFDTVFDANSDSKLIMDFKTSDVDTKDKADIRVKQSTQMQIYALAVEMVEHKRPTVALYFIESGIIAEYIFSDSELEKTKTNIMSVAEGIKEQCFDATPDYNQCHYCAYQHICPYRYKG